MNSEFVNSLTDEEFGKCLRKGIKTFQKNLDKEEDFFQRQFDMIVKGIDILVALGANPNEN